MILIRKRKMKVFYTNYFILIITLFNFHGMLSAQSINGMSGLLTLPSARMEQDKTVKAGINFLNKAFAPSVFSYHTFNYYLNVTILPCLEVGYTCTLFKATDRFIPYKKGKFVNQDRALSIKFRPLKEGRYFPSVVLGTNDISPSNILTSNTTNKFFNSVYLAMSKHFIIRKETIGVHLAYTYTKRIDARVKDLSLGVTYIPSFAPELNLIAEGTRNDLNVGATYLFFKHLFVQGVMQRGRYFSGGVGYKVYL